MVAEYREIAEIKEFLGYGGGIWTRDPAVVGLCTSAWQASQSVEPHTSLLAFEQKFKFPSIRKIHPFAFPNQSPTVSSQASCLILGSLEGTIRTIRSRTYNLWSPTRPKTFLFRRRNKNCRSRCEAAGVCARNYGFRSAICQAWFRESLQRVKKSILQARVI